MTSKDFTNDQSGPDNVLGELREHVKEIATRLERVHQLLGLESGSTASGSSGSGSQDAIKSQDPERALATLRQQLRQAREVAARRGVKVR
jgi:hypothetical protein